MPANLTPEYEKAELRYRQAATDEERASRLALADLTARVLARGLALLGIGAPERM